MKVYVLAKMTEDGDISSIHGVTEDEKIADVWEASGNPIWVLETSDLPCAEGYSANDPEDESGE